jgi:uncharacterized protein YhaN
MFPWKLALFALATVSATSVAAVGFAGRGDGQQGSAPAGGGGAPAATAQPTPAQKTPPPAIKALAGPVEVILPKQLERRLEAARQRVSAQRAYYEEGRITVDRFIQALQLLTAAELEQASTREERIIAAQNHRDRLQELLDREQAELQIGRGTVADVAEAALAREIAAVDLVKAHKAPKEGDLGSLQKRVESLEKQLERILNYLEKKQLERNLNELEKTRGALDKTSDPPK